MLAYLKELGPELLKSLFEIDTIEVILDDDSTRVQRMGASGWLLLSVFPVSKVKKILKNAKLAKKTGKAGNVIQLTEKELAILKKAESAGDGFKVEKNVGKKANGAKVEIPEQSLKHADVGDFTVNPSTGKVSKMKGGGHGQSNIDFLKENGFEVNIEKTYPNGVRTGNVPHHKTPSKRTGTGQSWFPENWTSKDIETAGQHIASQPNFASAKHGEVIFGDYNGVRVGVIKTDGKIGTIFPDGTKQP